MCLRGSVATHIKPPRIMLLNKDELIYLRPSRIELVMIKMLEKDGLSI